MRVKATLLMMSVMLLAAGAVVAADYVGASKCKMCHKTEHASWLETTHANAGENAKKSEKWDPAACVKCHATNSSEEMLGVQCEACHGPGSDFKKMSIMKDHEKAVANGLIVPSQETCDGCHVGNDHASEKVFKDNKANPKAIHKFKE